MLVKSNSFITYAMRGSRRPVIFRKSLTKRAKIHNDISLIWLGQKRLSRRQRRRQKSYSDLKWLLLCLTTAWDLWQPARMSANKYLTSKLIWAWIEISRRIKQSFSPRRILLWYFEFFRLFFLCYVESGPQKFGKFWISFFFPPLCLLCFFHKQKYLRLSAGGPANFGSGTIVFFNASDFNYF